jgi:hypothetical protein
MRFESLDDRELAEHAPDQLDAGEHSLRRLRRR